ncbi:LysR family transcriptional regulator [Janthinobacterium sp. 17J80-10]|uniref:LysR family transcriptional regulator n=1 Tax=Janthinobacterium sp. 17J80-10 TaxID=2497863 RepID=UPI0010053585|nr:LysR family transcriptional regulator [Janthinobacterium sp. 17J80-10]QAU35625.1 LysR family transcriptional regulator [Janthinobacterium sp. 17J80-10]
MDLKDLDLNLLLVFNQLLLQRRVSAVGEKLGLSQPAVSNALKRLRLLLNDELFLRTSRGMEPTPYALQLAEPIAYALNTIETSLNQRATFDAASSKRRFTIGMNDIGEIYFLPRLMDKLASIAPGVSVNTVRHASLNLREAMEAGQVDLAVGLLPELKAGFFQRRLFKQRYVCMFRTGHALDKEQISAAEFSGAEHVLVGASEIGHARIDETIAARGIRRNVKLTVPHFVAVGHILSRTDMVATVPERYAQECLAPFGLKSAPVPVELPEIAISLFWHAKYHKEPGIQWLRGVMFDTFAD